MYAQSGGTNVGAVASGASDRGEPDGRVALRLVNTGQCGERGIITAHRAVFLRFALTSLVGTAIDFALLWVLVSVAGLSVLPAKLVASEAAILNSFIWNERWTFAARTTRHRWPRRVASFHGAYVGSLVLSLLVVSVGVSLWGQHAYLVANALALPANFLWTYSVSNWVIWRRARPDTATVAPGAPGGHDLPAACQEACGGRKPHPADMATSTWICGCWMGHTLVSVSLPP